jgi:hypothetical protein
MLLTDFYPTPRELIANEVSVLGRLMDNPYIAEVHPRFARDARLYHDRYRDLRNGFQFFSYFDVYHAQWPRERKPIRGVEQPNLRLLLAGLIETADANTFGNISYCLTVQRRRPNRPSTLRKFHFDAVATQAARRQPHPVCHVQYCGGLVPLMGEAGPTAAQLNQMHPQLSEPRLFFSPVSLALLIDLTLREFPDVRSTRFRSTPEWRGIVRENEGLLLRRFYQQCAAVIVDNAHENKLLADECYVP